ncbi:hypothetical protein mflW37_5700 [Mesoplasma florum W37]|uniref:Uncharacterized protein n=1 Tax=Mesoplasma florum TaxID=2151 RepID=A0AAD0HS71_MESFO|nr:hypothetical protein [Mesoplasma florum]AGY41637.1 hypothetical protein mflW37_5700 [Mesoplasma florum W37]AVN65975.1 hypothetical protein MflW12_5700 [Mesoplasma florum]
MNKEDNILIWNVKSNNHVEINLSNIKAIQHISEGQSILTMNDGEEIITTDIYFK